MRAAKASAFVMPFIVFLAMVSTVIVLWLGGNRLSCKDCLSGPGCF